MRFVIEIDLDDHVENPIAKMETELRMILKYDMLRRADFHDILIGDSECNVVGKMAIKKIS